MANAVKNTGKSKEKVTAEQNVTLSPKEERAAFKAEKKNLKAQKKAERRASEKCKTAWIVVLTIVVTLVVFLVGYYLGADGFTITF